MRERFEQGIKVLTREPVFQDHGAYLRPSTEEKTGGAEEDLSW